MIRNEYTPRFTVHSCIKLSILVWRNHIEKSIVYVADWMIPMLNGKLFSVCISNGNAATIRRIFANGFFSKRRARHRFQSGIVELYPQKMVVFRAMVQILHRISSKGTIMYNFAQKFPTLYANRCWQARIKLTHT